MPDPWMPGLRHDPGRGSGYKAGQNAMRMVVDHNTGGTNSYEICKWGRPGYRTGLCQILLPQVGVPWQFTEIDAVCYHAGSKPYGDYNDDGPGIEVERPSLDVVLSDDQVYWLGEIVWWLDDVWGIPPIHYWGPRFPPHQADFHGHVNHSDIHPNLDGLTREEWDQITTQVVPVPDTSIGDGMYISVTKEEGWFVVEGGIISSHFTGKPNDLGIPEELGSPQWQQVPVNEMHPFDMAAIQKRTSVSLKD